MMRTALQILFLLSQISVSLSLAEIRDFRFVRGNYL